MIAPDARALDRLRARLSGSGDAAVGSLAVARGWISLDQLRECLRVHSADRRVPVAQILLDRRLLTPQQLADLIVREA